MKKILSVVLLLIICLLAPAKSFAWNSTGHEVVARIAWENMQPSTRIKVIRLLAQAPSDSDIVSVFPQDDRPALIRERDFFVLTSIWADIVRDDDMPERKAKYHHSNWHYTNFFWEQKNGQAIDVTTMHPEATNIVERLQALQASVRSADGDAANRAIALAWIVHLVGDIHQPLHTSARVTELEPKGDQGGNLFLLTPIGTPSEKTRRLHGFWDNILSDNIPRLKDEADPAYANRIASIIMHQFPRSGFKSRLNPGQFDEWAGEGLATAKRSAYPKSLKRFRTPSANYRRMAFDTSRQAVALAGYRLANLLDSLFGN